MKKIKLRLVPFREVDGKLYMRPIADQFIIERPAGFVSGALIIEVDVKHLKIEETWDETHEN